MSPLWEQLTLRVKLTLGYAAIFSLSVLLGAAGVYLVARGTLIRSLDTTLQETASVARANIERTADRYFFGPSLKPSGDLYVELLSLQGDPLVAVGLGPPGPPPLTLEFRIRVGWRRVPSTRRTSASWTAAAGPPPRLVPWHGWSERSQS